MFLNLSFPTVFTVVLHPVRRTQTSKRKRTGAQLPEQPHKARGKVSCTLGLSFQVMLYLCESSFIIVNRSLFIIYLVRMGSYQALEVVIPSTCVRRSSYISVAMLDTADP